MNYDYKITDDDYHDAILVSIENIWRKRICIINIRMWDISNNISKLESILFSDITECTVLHYSKWGESESILKIEFNKDDVKIIMQSGDAISIK